MLVRTFAFACLLAGLVRAEIPSAAIFELESRGVDSNSTRIIEDALGDGIMRTGKMRLLERSQMKTILQEQGFQQSGTCDGSECAVQVGKVLGVQRGIIGSVGKIGRKWVLNARVIDVETGEVMATSQRSMAGEEDQVMTDLVPEVVADLTKEKRQAKKEEVVSDSTKASSAWIWWTLGGVAVVGGGAAAALLLMGDDGGSQAPAPTPETPAETKTGDIEFQWTTP